MKFLKNAQSVRITAISLSLFVGTALMLGKFYIYTLTRSAAVLSDALESIINVVASAFALVSIVIADRPPDQSHPYGHGKIEYFSAGFEGALIILAALGIFITGWSHLFHTDELPHIENGMLLLFGISLINLLLGAGLLLTGKRTASLTLVADGKHVLTDVYTSGGVVAGLLCAYLTGWYWLDGAIAYLVGLNILFSGWQLVRQSFTGLMDAADTEFLKGLADLITQNRKEVWIDIHQLRAWRAGNFAHIDFHLILPQELSLEESHRESKTLEKIIVDHFGGKASVLIHTDPCEDPDCPTCRRHLCRIRSANLSDPGSWSLESLIRQGRHNLRPADTKTDWVKYP
ncbi:MAG: cation diffusion facilitator family transporter [Thermodesulfobacteriota bacterium]